MNGYEIAAICLASGATVYMCAKASYWLEKAKMYRKVCGLFPMAKNIMESIVSTMPKPPNYIHVDIPENVEDYDKFFREEDK